MCYNRGRSKRILKCLERSVGGGGPVELAIFLQHAWQERYYCRVFHDEAVVDVCESQKSLEIFDRYGGGPSEDGLDLLSFHGYALYGDGISQEISAGDVELSCFWFAENTSFLKFGEDGTDVGSVSFLVVTVH